MSQGFKSHGKRRQHPLWAAALRLEGVFSLGKMRKGQPKDRNSWVGLGLGFAHPGLQSASSCPAPVAPGTVTRRALPCSPSCIPRLSLQRATAAWGSQSTGTGPAITLQSHLHSSPLFGRNHANPRVFDSRQDRGCGFQLWLKVFLQPPVFQCVRC